MYMDPRGTPSRLGRSNLSRSEGARPLARYSSFVTLVANVVTLQEPYYLAYGSRSQSAVLVFRPCHFSGLKYFAGIEEQAWETAERGHSGARRPAPDHIDERHEHSCAIVRAVRPGFTIGSGAVSATA